MHFLSQMHKNCFKALATNFSHDKKYHNGEKDRVTASKGDATVMKKI